MDLCATWTLPTIMGSRRCRARSAVTGTPRPSSRETGRPGTKGLGTAKANSDGSITVSAWRYGPLTTMMPALLSSARSGGLDGALLTSKQFYQTDCTKPLLLLAGRRPAVRPCPGRAPARRAVGHDERDGRLPRPGMAVAYTCWYQIKPFSPRPTPTSLVMAVMGVLGLAMILVPFIPGVRDVPRRIPISRLMWREHYRASAG